MMALAGRCALVTGAGRRLGSAVAMALVREGVQVLLHYHASAESARQLADKLIQQGGRADILQADLAHPDAAANLLLQAREKLGFISILINSAAIFEPGSLRETSLETWQRHQDLILTAPFLLMQAMARQEEFHNPKVSGAVVNILDQRIHHPRPGHLAYTVAKSALWTLTQMAAGELAPAIRVNAVAPGPILPAPDGDTQRFRKIARQTPLGRPGSTADVADTVLFLLRQEYITGECIFVDGGEHL